MQGLVDLEFCPLGILLGHLFCLNSLLIDVRERKLCDRDIIKLDPKFTQAFCQANADSAGDLLTLLGELRRVVARDDRPENFIDYRGEHTTIEVSSKFSVDLINFVLVWLVHHSERQVDGLEIFASS